MQEILGTELEVGEEYYVETQFIIVYRGEKKWRTQEKYSAIYYGPFDQNQGGFIAKQIYRGRNIVDKMYYHPLTYSTDPNTTEENRTRFYRKTDTQKTQERRDNLQKRQALARTLEQLPIHQYVDKDGQPPFSKGPDGQSYFHVGGAAEMQEILGTDLVVGEEYYVLKQEKNPHFSVDGQWENRVKYSGTYTGQFSPFQQRFIVIRQFSGNLLLPGPQYETTTYKTPTTVNENFRTLFYKKTDTQKNQERRDNLQKRQALAQTVEQLPIHQYVGEDGQPQFARSPDGISYLGAGGRRKRTLRRASKSKKRRSAARSKKRRARANKRKKTRRTKR